MTFLKKLGSLIAQGIRIANGAAVFAPAPVQAAVAQAIGFVEQGLGIIVGVEAANAALTSPLPGTEKLQAATPLIASLILQSSALSGKKVANAALFNEGAKAIADGLAKIANSLHEDNIHTA